MDHHVFHTRHRSKLRCMLGHHVSDKLCMSKLDACWATISQTLLVCWVCAGQPCLWIGFSVLSLFNSLVALQYNLKRPKDGTLWTFVVECIRKLKSQKLSSSSFNPFKVDKPILDPKASHISAENEKFFSEFRGSEIASFTCASLHLFTNHGLHLNRRGKAKVAKSVPRLLIPDDNKNNLEDTQYPSLCSSTHLPSSHFQPKESPLLKQTCGIS